MGAAAGDVSATVELSADKWFMDRVPWALWLIAAGLAFALNGGGRNGSGMGHALVYLAMLGLAFAGYAATQKLDDSSIPFYVTLPVGLVLFVGVALVIDLVTGSSGRSAGSATGSSLWTRLVNPPMHVGGWLMAYLGVAWIAYSIYQHIHPGRPTLMLSPEGIHLHQSWLKDVLIPWREVHAASRPGGTSGALEPLSNPNMVCVQVSRELYERQIAPKLSALAPPGAGNMFIVNGELTTVVLATSMRAGELAGMIDALVDRWSTFRERDASLPAGGAPGTRIVHGAWSFTGSSGQRVVFLAPALAIAAVLVHAAVRVR